MTAADDRLPRRRELAIGLALPALPGRHVLVVTCALATVLLGVSHEAWGFPDPGVPRVAPRNGPDLVVRSLGDPPASVEPGGRFRVTETTKNVGNRRARRSATRYYLSLDAKKDAGDIRLEGQRSVKPLAPRKGARGSVDVAVPAGTAAGSFLLLACADDLRKVKERSEKNNCRASGNRVGVVVPGPAGGPPPAGDTTPPSVPELSFGGFANASATGHTVYFRTGASGTVAVSATASDPESGIAHLTLPSLGAGWTGGGDDPAPPYEAAYSFDSGATDPAEPLHVTATNRVGLTSPPTAFTVTPDGSAPTTTVRCDGSLCSPDPYGAPVTVSLEATDDGSGVKEIRYTLDGSEPNTDQGAVYSGPFELAGRTILRYRAFDRVGNVEGTATLEVVAEAPETLEVPPVDPTVPTNVFDATRFLYEGDDPIQTGVASGTIEIRRAAVLRGRVLDRDGDPLAGVEVTVRDHAELGRTVTRENGRFDMAVNGGGALDIVFEKDGFIPVHRQVEPGWQEYYELEDVILIGYDQAVTEIETGSSEAVQTARGTVQTDSDGSRRTTLLFGAGTTAEMVFADGRTQPLPTFHVRATEFTVGPGGAAAMPAELPPSSGYTYAVELSVDEAVAAGASRVRFSRPVTIYVENFLEFPVGGVVPSGYYDRDRGEWIASANGRIVELVAETGGLADLNVDLDPEPEPEDELAALGIGEAERRELAVLYEPGQTLWRVPVTHFTPYDLNWMRFPLPRDPEPFDPDTPPTPSPDTDDPGNDDDCPQEGSIIGCENRTLGEDVAVTGTPFTLHYESDRLPGRKVDKVLQIPITGPTVPPDLRRIEVSASIAGKVRHRTFSAAPNQTWTVMWDGRDLYGRTVSGSAPVMVRMSYVSAAYPAQALDRWVSAWDEFVNGFIAFARWLPPDVVELFRAQMAAWVNDRRRVFARAETSRTRTWRSSASGRVRVGRWDARGAELGGWTLDVHHTYDPGAGRLYLGNGEERSGVGLRQVLQPIAGGNVNCGQSGDGGPALDAELCSPHGGALAPDGTFYFIDREPEADGDAGYVRKITPDGTITRVAGSGVCGSPPETGPALSADLCDLVDLALAPDGSLFLAGFRRLEESDDHESFVWRLLPDGTLSRLAAFGGRVAGIGAGADGSLYIADEEGLGHGRVLHLGTNGRLSTITGRNEDASGCRGENGVLAGASAVCRPADVAVGPDGSLFVAESGSGTIRKITPQGMIYRHAGMPAVGDAPCFGVDEDGASADRACLDSGGRLAVAPDGSVYFLRHTSFNFSTDGIRKVAPDGVVTTVVGVPRSLAGQDDAGLATAEANVRPEGLDVAPDGSIYFTDAWLNSVRKVTSPLPGLEERPITIPSANGIELWQFDRRGRHLRTRDALTGAVAFEFGYDTAGRLTSVTDRSGNLTRVERDASGKPTAIIAPGGQRTELAVNGEGFLTGADPPGVPAISFAYAEGGLLTSMTDPNGGVSTYEYDSLGRLARAENPAGAVKSLTSENIENGTRVTLRTGLGRATVYEVQHLANGNIRRAVTAPSGARSVATSDPTGKARVSHPDGSETTLTLAPDPRWGVLAPYARRTATVTPGGRTSEARERRTVVMSSDDPILGFESQRTEASVDGRTTVFEYDADTRTLDRTSQEGRRWSVVFDAAGRIGRWQPDPQLDAVTYEYDGRGRLVALRQGSAARLFEYDAQNRLTAETDPLDHRSEYSYDAADRPASARLPTGDAFGLSRDANGNVTALTSPGGSVHAMTYTAADLLATHTPPGGVPYSWTYDADGEPAGLTLPTGATIDFLSDAAGRDTGQRDALGSVTVAYDGFDRVTSVTRTPTAGAAQTVAYTYDGQLGTGATWTGAVDAQVRHTFDASFRRIGTRLETGPDTVDVAYAYDDDDLVTGIGPFTLAREGPEGAMTGITDGTLAVTQTYDRLGQVTSRSYAVGGVEGYASTFVYDAMGRLTRAVETVGGASHTLEYAYDPLGQLVEVRRDGVAVESFAYDARGNRIERTAGGVTEVASYDAQDRLTQRGSTSYAFDANGDMTGRGGDSFAYAPSGELLSATADGTTIAYAYDGLGRRVTRTDAAGTYRFFYTNPDDPYEVSAARSPSGELTTYHYDGEGKLLAFRRGPDLYYVAADQVGSPRVVLDATGAVVKTLAYDAFGVVTSDSAPGFDLPIGFAGGLVDRATGLVRFGQRDHDPAAGRWTQRDPIFFDGGQANLYAYVENDPVRSRDPSGLQASSSSGGRPSRGGSRRNRVVIPAPDTDGIRIDPNAPLSKCQDELRNPPPLRPDPLPVCQKVDGGWKAPRGYKEGECIITVEQQDAERTLIQRARDGFQHFLKKTLYRNKVNVSTEQSACCRG